MLNLPNIFTMSNLFCGCCAFMLVIGGRPDLAAWFTLASFVFDYADGMAARALGIASPLGKELDSLADVISFGAVPAAMMYTLLAGAMCGRPAFYPMGIVEKFAPMGHFPICLWALTAIILAMFSGLRLGKFNLDTRQANYFIGLSTPACTIFVMGLTLGAYHNRFNVIDWVYHPALLFPLLALLCYLLISEIPMFGMKIKRFDLRSNLMLLGFAALFVGLWIVLRELALSVIIVLYVLTSLFLKNKVIASNYSSGLWPFILFSRHEIYCRNRHHAPQGTA